MKRSNDIDVTAWESTATNDRCDALVKAAESVADDIVKGLVTAPHDAISISAMLDRMSAAQERYIREFPHPTDEAKFWDHLWLWSDRLRGQWDRVERAAERAAAARRDELRMLLDGQRRTLYEWMRRSICERAPRVPSQAHFELGLDTKRPDRRGLHQRIEGLAESIRCFGRFPDVRETMPPPGGSVSFAIIYGGGWNESAFSVLREARRLGRMDTFVAFDHPGPALYGRVGPHVVRRATAGLVQMDDEARYVLAGFEPPAVVHFACPHQWTGPPPHELGIPVLRSELTLEIVDDKLTTTRALRWHAGRTGADLPLIQEEGIPSAAIPADLCLVYEKSVAAMGRLQRKGVREVVVKPVRGEQKQGVGYFKLPVELGRAAAHCVRLALETGAVIQQRIRPPGSEDFNWRVLVALAPGGRPRVVGRFARVGHADVTEKARDRDILARCGMSDAEVAILLERIDRVSLNAFEAVREYAMARHPHFPWRPLGGGSYHVPYFLGIDLIGDARVMEVNGNEVAGMSVDDELYPETRGRSNRTVLQSAEPAARAYKAVIDGTL